MKRLVCELCGENLTASEKGYFCPVCGAKYQTNDAEAISLALEQLVEEAKMERLAHAKHFLWDAVHERNPSAGKIQEAAKQVLLLNQGDDLARFYEVAMEDDPTPLNEWLLSSSVNESLAEEVYRWCLLSLEARNILAFKDFIGRHFAFDDRFEKLSALEEEAEKLEEGVYMTNLPRDVFLAYSSNDSEAAFALADYLEDNGFTVFVAARNLRHGKAAAENYAEALKDAMAHCKGVVFVSSESSRQLSCDALRFELPFIKDHLPKMRKIEYLLEPYGNRTKEAARMLLKNVFAGLEWCQNRNDLLQRILDFDKPLKNEEKAPIIEKKEAPTLALSASTYYSLGLSLKTSKDFNGALEQFMAAYRLGHPKSAFEAAIILHDVKKDYEKAYELFAFAAEKGNLDGAYNWMGVMHTRNEKKPFGSENAIPFYEKAASLGNPYAFGNLSSYYFNRNDYQKAFSYAEKGAAKGNVASHYYLGLLYLSPKNGMPTNLEKGASHLAIASKNQYKDAETRYKYWRNFVLKGNRLIQYKANPTYLFLPDGLEAIGEKAFESCRYMKAAVLPSSCEQIGDYAFGRCYGLEMVNVPTPSTYVSGLAFSGRSLTDRSQSTVHVYAQGGKPPLFGGNRSMINAINLCKESTKGPFYDIRTVEEFKAFVQSRYAK